MTTQSRFWISSHEKFEDAARAKRESENDNPDIRYQVRRGSDKGKEVFRLVQRFKANEVRVINESKRSRKKKGKRSEDLSWARG